MEWFQLVEITENLVVFGSQSSLTDTVRRKFAKFEVSSARWGALDREIALFRFKHVFCFLKDFLGQVS